MSKPNRKEKNPSGGWWSNLSKRNQGCQKIVFWWLILLLPSQLGKHFWFDFSQVLGLRIDYLAPTLYLTDVLVIFLLLLWFWEKRLSVGAYCNTPLRVAVIFLFINCLFAASQPVAFLKFFKISELFFLGLYVAEKKFTRRLLPAALSLAVVLTSLLAISQFFCQSSLGGWLYWLGERHFDISTPGIAKFDWQGRLLLRPYATFSHPNSLAGFLLVALILVAAKLKFWRWPVVAVGVVAIGLSFSRATWLAGGLLLVFHLRRTSPLRNAAHASGGIYAFFASTSFLQRADLVKAAWQMIKAKPFWGVGLGNFIVRLPDFWQVAASTYWVQPVHNIFLLTAAETGLAGLAILLFFWGQTVRRVATSPSFMILAALLIIFFTGLFDHYWLTLQQNQLLLAVVFGLAWQAKTSKMKKYEGCGGTIFSRRSVG
ncbi:hypothetical protein COU97_01100 [Candidatus Shapirobacteria bacterium CG10_big_fil_rev_8_21_14_0_10_48_15]|uniref:O-antigen ligase-related domain-containing protein n=1 Tax=Candidatus Shapirobacteria bacterium CG10_big_fil_rev_8_21_14_0_10_48_15 TaxID=1974484 RepID=A0A2M8L7G5_9BACT|nr:MAG: hypothetical protein COU97_01100 [Candidatus Shapirobacteria bacterium CG10_big_fil_rev_8_21_14_0_10_48_15]